MSAETSRHVVVQAGGRGSRLGGLTVNKPKCLLSVDGEPLLYRLFRQIPDARFTVVVDTHADVVANYLRVVPPTVQVALVRARKPGSAAGLAEALALIEDFDAPVLVTWCDLFLSEGLPEFAFGDMPVLGLTDGFTCRWSVDEAGNIVEAASGTRGVAGFFSFPSKSVLPELPDSGEFVRFLRDRGPRMVPLVVPGLREFGTLDAVSAYASTTAHTRFFNRITVGEREVVKTSRVPEFDRLLEAEADWYELVGQLGFDQVPRLRARSPLTIDRVDGVHPFELDPHPALQLALLERMADCLSSLHALRSAPANAAATRSMYLHKTIARVESIRGLIPNQGEPVITVNGVRCRNPLHPRHESWLAEVVDAVGVAGFSLIHGDPTFSNMLVDPDGLVWLIDPRGTFGEIAFDGDPRYDWAKVLYSVEGNYDQFNRRRFHLRVDGTEVSLDIASSGWETQAGFLRERAAGEAGSGQSYALDAIHALIWLSLSGYALDDVDSILGAFYNGIAYLERAER